MTPKEALKHLVEEFVVRFDCHAEDCAEWEKTHEAMAVLAQLVDVGPLECPMAYCDSKH
jgi:hypothetical protein